VSAVEVNFDGLVGPTHNYAGLAYGNLASQAYAGHLSRPRAAALQGLAKLALLFELGVEQAILPPPPRPNLAWLGAIGFTGSAAHRVERAGREAPLLLAAAYSASSMWAANTATVTPSADSADGRVHITPANLVTELHRSHEPSTTGALLHAAFPDSTHFAHHDPLPASLALADEGAANHMRLTAAYGTSGVELFVHGRDRRAGPQRFPARQTEAASRAVARLHGLPMARCAFARQNPAAIEAGVFHNDVIATGDRDLLLVHADAFAEQAKTLEGLRRTFATQCGRELRVVEVASSRLPLSEAVATYLFNGQLVRCGSGARALICPEECRESRAVSELVEGWLTEKIVDAVHHVSLRESMRNGGGPACMRLRVVLEEDELGAVPPALRWSEGLHQRLVAWVERHYREELRPEDLRDPALIGESQSALDALSDLLGLGSLYPFQQ